MIDTRLLKYMLKIDVVSKILFVFFFYTSFWKIFKSNFDLFAKYSRLSNLYINCIYKSVNILVYDKKLLYLAKESRALNGEKNF